LWTGGKNWYASLGDGIGFEGQGHSRSTFFLGWTLWSAAWKRRVRIPLHLWLSLLRSLSQFTYFLSPRAKPLRPRHRWVFRFGIKKWIRRSCKTDNASALHRNNEWSDVFHFAVERKLPLLCICLTKKKENTWSRLWGKQKQVRWKYKGTLNYSYGDAMVNFCIYFLR
jgi:hypothetical protein